MIILIIILLISNAIYWFFFIKHELKQPKKLFLASQQMYMTLHLYLSKLSEDVFNPDASLITVKSEELPKTIFYLEMLIEQFRFMYSMYDKKSLSYAVKREMDNLYQALSGFRFWEEKVHYFIKDRGLENLPKSLQEVIKKHQPTLL